MASAAAIAGVSAHGLAWKRTILLRSALEPLRDAEKIGDVARILGQVADRVEAFAKRLTAADEGLRDRLNDIIDDLRNCADDPDEARSCLSDLYDIFDYHRVLVE